MSIDKLDTGGLEVTEKKVTVSSSDVNTTSSLITSNSHGLETGDEVKYFDGGGTAIGGLTDNSNFFVTKVNDNSFRVSSTLSDTKSNIFIILTSVGTGTSHVFNKTNSIQSEIFNSVYPVGSIYINASNSANPRTYLLGGGSSDWQAFTQGRTMVGVGATTDLHQSSVNFSSGQTEAGSTRIVLEAKHLPEHQHVGGYTQVESRGSEFGRADTIERESHRVDENILGFEGADFDNEPLLTSREIFLADSSLDHDVPPLNETHPNGFNVGQSHNNVQPYRVSYVWKRVQ